MTPGSTIILWQTTYLSNSISTPTVTDEGVYISDSCRTFKFNLVSGNLVWRSDFGCSSEWPGVAANTIYYDEKLYLNTGSSTQNLILDEKTGSFLGTFTGQIENYITLKVAFNQGNGIFTKDENSTHKVEARSVISQTLQWSTVLPYTGNLTKPLIINDKIYVATDQGYIYALDSLSGAVQWNNLVESGGSVNYLTGGSNRLFAATANQLITFGSDDLTAGYNSDPLPGNTLNLGEGTLDVPISKTIQISNTGNSSLHASNPVFSGQNPADFSLQTGFPLDTESATSSKEIIVQCLPSKVGQRTAILTMNTNDPNLPTVSYPVSCTGLLEVIKDTDNGQADTPGSFSYLLGKATSGQTISFGLSNSGDTIHVTATLPPVPEGVKISGSCSTNGPGIILDGSNTLPGSNGLLLKGNDVLYGLIIKGFPGYGIKNSSGGTGNSLSCIKVQK